MPSSVAPEASFWRGPVRQSTLPPERPAKIALGLLAALGLVWLMTPRLHGPFTDHVHKEDGLIFLSGQQAGDSLLATYTGYLHVGPRLITEACALLPPEAMATCLAGGSAGVRVALAVLMFAVLTPYVRGWAWAMGAAALVIFGGIGQQEVLGNVTNLRWFLDVAATIALLGAFRRLWLIVLAAALMALGVLSDPLALLLAPVALWRVLALEGRARIVPALFFPVAAVHLLLLNPSARDSYLTDFFLDPLLNTQNIVVRSMTETVLGETGTTVAVNVLGATVVTAVTLAGFLALYAYGVRKLDGQQKWMVLLLGVGGLLFLMATVNFIDPKEIDVAQGVARASRYALIPSLLIGASIMVLLSDYPRSMWGRATLITTSTLIVLSSVVDSRGDEWATRGPTWSDTVKQSQHACLTGAERVTVNVTPQGVPLDWTADLQCTWVGSESR